VRLRKLSFKHEIYIIEQLSTKPIPDLPQRLVFEGLLHTLVYHTCHRPKERP